MTPLMEAVWTAAEMMLYAVVMLLYFLLLVSVPIAVIYGATWALSKLARRVRAGRARRRAGPRPRR